MQPTEKKFVDGMMFKRSKEGTPSFVKGNISIKLNEFMNFIAQNKVIGEEWMNFTLKESKGGKLYLELDTWKPTPKGTEEEKKVIDASEIPF